MKTYGHECKDTYEYFYLSQGNKGCIVGHVDLQTDPQIPVHVRTRQSKCKPCRTKTFLVSLQLFFF